jgi:hypothetical protein
MRRAGRHPRRRSRPRNILTPAIMKPTFFPTPEAFRKWLERHCEVHTELMVGFYKTGSGKPSITWPQSVEKPGCAEILQPTGAVLPACRHLVGYQRQKRRNPPEARPDPHRPVEETPVAASLDPIHSVISGSYGNPRETACAPAQRPPQQPTAESTLPDCSPWTPPASRAAWPSAPRSTPIAAPMTPSL